MTSTVETIDTTTELRILELQLEELQCIVVNYHGLPALPIWLDINDLMIKIQDLKGETKEDV